MEKEILVALNFDIFSVSSYQFYTYFYFISSINNKKLFHLGHLILEICLLNIDIMTYNQSLLAIGALLVAKKCLQIKCTSNNVRLFYNYNEKEIKKYKKKSFFFWLVLSITRIQILLWKNLKEINICLFLIYLKMIKN